MLKKQKCIFFIKLLVFCFLNFYVTSAAVEQCCPDSYLDESTSFCAKGKLKFLDNCPNGAFLFDSNEENNDDFLLNENGTLFMKSGNFQVGSGQYCVSTLQKNGSTIPHHQVALICFAPPKETSSIFSKILVILSILFLMVTLYIYIVLPNLRNMRGKCVMAFICSLLGGYIFLIVLQMFPELNDTSCISHGAALYFFMASAIFWNNIITFNIWKTVRNTFFNLSNRTWAFIYTIWGFGIPFLMVSLLFILENVSGGNHIRPQFGKTSCWFGGKQETWIYFYGPISVLLLLNTLMFIDCSWILWKNYKKIRFSNVQSLRYKYLLYLKLFLLMGLTWTFEVLSFAASDHDYFKYLWAVTDCINRSQGVIIFLILIVFRPKVRLGLLKNKVLGINWPQSWANAENQESHEVSTATDIELNVQKLKMLSESQ